MSVLTEALTLLIRTTDLDDCFPGGADAFVKAAGLLSPPPRYVCGDGRLVGLSFYGVEHAQPFVDLLRGGAGEAASIALVDQQLGPTCPCSWLEWSFDEDGFSYAWLEGTDPGELAADDDWTPERSWALVRRDRAGEPERLVPLAEEGGLATWLDLETGGEVIGSAGAPLLVTEARGEFTRGFLGDASLEPLACRGPAEQEPEAVDGTPGDEAGDADDAEEHAAALRERIVEILDGEELQYQPWGATWLEVAFNAHAARIVVRLAAAENGKFVRLYATSDVRVPEAYRPAACELLTRANWGLPIGGFEMDLRDGEVVYKGTMYLGPERELTHDQLCDSIRGAVYVFDRYYPALMRVVYGGVTPEEAIAEVEG